MIIISMSIISSCSSRSSSSIIIITQADDILTLPPCPIREARIRKGEMRQAMRKRLELVTLPVRLNLCGSSSSSSSSSSSYCCRC